MIVPSKNGSPVIPKGIIYKECTYLGDIDAFRLIGVDATEQRIAELEAKLEALTGADDFTAGKESAKAPPTKQWAVGKRLESGHVVQDNGNKFRVKVPHTAQADWKPTTLYNAGNRTLFEMLQPDIPDSDLCAETPAWDGGKWHDYIVGYKVKHDSAIWEAINTTHTWIAPAHDGDGAISWKHIKDCP